MLDSVFKNQSTLSLSPHIKEKPQTLYSAKFRKWRKKQATVTMYF